jgi:predicted HD phosphohydrolase
MSDRRTTFQALLGREADRQSRRLGVSRRAFLDGSLGALAACSLARQLPTFASVAEAQDGFVPPSDESYEKMRGAPIDWDAALAASEVQQPALAEHVLALLGSMRELYLGFSVSQLVHATQTATRAVRANQPDEVVLIALLHDIGEVLAGFNHAEIAAAIVRPYVSPDTYYAVRHHMEFMLAHYGDRIAQPTTMRDRYAHHAWYDLAALFTDELDQRSFDPNYPTLPLEEFEPLVRGIFERPVRHLYLTAFDCA